MCKTENIVPNLQSSTVLNGLRNLFFDKIYLKNE